MVTRNKNAKTLHEGALSDLCKLKHKHFRTGIQMGNLIKRLGGKKIEMKSCEVLKR